MKKMTALLLSAALLCPTLALAEDTVKIGIFEPMTGATAAGGSMEKEGFDLANELYPDVLGRWFTATTSPTAPKRRSPRSPLWIKALSQCWVLTAPACRWRAAKSSPKAKFRR